MYIFKPASRKRDSDSIMKQYPDKVPVSLPFVSAVVFPPFFYLYVVIEVKFNMNITLALGDRRATENREKSSCIGQDQVSCAV